MKFGIPISFALHAFTVFGGVLIFNGQYKDSENVQIIPLKIVTVSERTNIKPTQRKPDPIAEPQEDVAPIQGEELPEAPQEQAEKMTEVKPKPSLDVEKTPAFNLDALSNMVDKARSENPDTNTQKILHGEAAKVNQSGSGEQTDLTVNAPDYIRAKMEPCWLIDKGAKNYQNLRVEIVLNLDEDAKIITARVRNNAQIIASSNNAWRAARENVVAALHECAPYVGLATLDYNAWKTMKLNFQPGA